MSSPTVSALDRADRVVLRCVAALSFLVAAGFAVVAGWRLLGPYLFGEAVPVELRPADGDTGLGSADGIAYSSVEYEVVGIAVGSVSNGPLAQVVVTSALAAAIGAIVAAAMGYTLVRLTMGQPFHRSLYALTNTAGGALAVGGFAVEGIGGGGRMVIAGEINNLLGTERFVPGFTMDLTASGIGMAIVALGTVFLIGQRLQRDTEGLV